MERSRWSSTQPTRALSSTPPTGWPLFPQHQRTVKHLSCLQSLSAVHSPGRLLSCRPERPGRETPCCGDCLGLSGIQVQRVHPELRCFSPVTGRGHAGVGQQLPPCIYPNFLLFLGCLSWCVVSCQLACESVPGQAMLGTDDAIFLQMREWGRQVHRLRCSHAPASCAHNDAIAPHCHQLLGVQLPGTPNPHPSRAILQWASESTFDPWSDKASEEPQSPSVAAFESLS